MIYLALPVGVSHGWGICGKYTAREMAKLTGPGGTGLITEPLSAESVGDELELAELAEIFVKPELVRGFPVVGGVARVPGPLLASIVDKQLQPLIRGIRGTRTVGYTFFEENIFAPEWIENGRRNYEVIATGSTWCTEVLRQHGMMNVETVLQGIDPRVFFPAAADEREGEEWREFFRDRFVVFSGGKFELRKGQDIVMRAFKVLSERHKDVVLINSWYNPWPATMETMGLSPHVRLTPQSGTLVQVVTRLLADNGVDVSRVVTLSPRANALMARVYRNTDVGIFPNRCEGGTNLVLMEYMACGKPVVATATSGHADVVRPEHALIIGNTGERSYNGANGQPVARWPEPNLEEAIEKLEWAYQHRGEMREMGARAGEFMKGMTWRGTAAGFLKMLTA